MSDNDRKYVEEAKIFPINKACYYREFYVWKTYDKIIFYRNYDSIYDTLKFGQYSAPITVGKRKLNKEIRIYVLPNHCYK